MEDRYEVVEPRGADGRELGQCHYMAPLCKTWLKIAVERLVA
jgi:hypothetical protein